MVFTLRGHRILIVEDEWMIALDLERSFEAVGADVIVANRLSPALKVARTERITGAVLDHGLPDGDSAELLKHVAGLGVPVVFYTGYQLPARNGIRVIMKPAPPESVVIEMERLLERRSAVPLW